MKAVSYLTLLAIILFCFGPIVSATEVASTAEVDGRGISSKGAIVIDFESGVELYSYNADERLPPGSMTKTMALYLVYEAIHQGRIDFDTVVPISENAYEASCNSQETNVPLDMSETYTVNELLDAVYAVSALGAITALAELIGGSTDEVLQMVRAKAVEWGLNAEFYTITGGTKTKISPRSMAVITRNTLMAFPEVLEKSSQSTIMFKGKEYPSTNNLLGNYEGLDGYKTGANSISGACLAGTAKRGDTRIIIVTMGSTREERAEDATILLDYGFSVMEELRISEDDIIPAALPALSDDGQSLQIDDIIDTEQPPVAEQSLPTPDLTEAESQVTGLTTDYNDPDDNDKGSSRLLPVLISVGCFSVLCAAAYIYFTRVLKKKSDTKGVPD